jgi:transglutaminase-like putative cysteine protease
MRNITIGIILLFAIIFASGCIELKDLMGYSENASTETDNWTMPQRDLIGGVYGIVADMENAPLENASVMLIGNASNYSILTDADGAYNLSEVSEGIYTLVVRKEGYANQTVANFTILGGYSRSWRLFLVSSAGSLRGTITDLKKTPLENASVTLIGNASNYTGLSDADGNYNISGVPEGAYGVVAWKAGHKNVTVANFTLLGGRSYSWNATIARDCLYHSVNASVNYVLKYGFSGTINRGEMEFFVSYPQGASYEIYPAAKSGLSEASTAYQAGNRMLEWTLNNSKGNYASVSGHVYMNMNGTGTMKIYNQKEMGIQDAASRQPNYLGSETNKEGETLIDISDPEIRAIAQRVKRETGSNDTWTVARALFVWLKNNTVYYIDPEAYNYSRTPLETLHSGKGKCDELSNLYISVLRADGIPARFVKGYVVERNPEQYMGHRWVEFYDGEWVPVEVSGDLGNASAEADANFAVQRPDHVNVFIDDGTDEAIGGGDYNTGLYYGQAPVFNFDVYYDAISYNPMYRAICADGTRELVKERE